MPAGLAVLEPTAEVSLAVRHVVRLPVSSPLPQQSICTYYCTGARPRSQLPKLKMSLSRVVADCRRGHQLARDEGIRG
jgi:hypothetical protein